MQKPSKTGRLFYVLAKANLIFLIKKRAEARYYYYLKIFFAFFVVIRSISEKSFS